MMNKSFRWGIDGPTNKTTTKEKASMADRVGQQFGDYRLIKNLGAGGFADVYLGEHIYLGTQAAVKVLKGAFAPKDIEHFLTEAKTIARLEHPHIVRVITFSVAKINTQEIPFLVLEFAPNGTLRQLYPKGMHLPLETIMSNVKQIADGLQFAHNQKLIHRDIKPENMLLGRHNEVLLSDFGIALTTPQTDTLATQEMAGTIAYMAPEQIKGKPRPASDQYALGVAVYEWLSGERPFNGPPWEVLNQHIYAPPPSLREKVPTISPAIERVVLRTLAKEPQQRFPSVQEFATALEQACQGAATSPTSSPVNLSSGPPASSLPTERAIPPIQVAGTAPANQAIAQPASSLPARQAFPPTQIASTTPTNQDAAPTVQATSPRYGSQLSTPREPIQDTPPPANAEPRAYAQSPVRPSAEIGLGGKASTIERQRRPGINRVALLVGLAILVVVVGGGLLLYPLLTRGTTTVTTTTHPGTTATTATNPAALATSNGTMFGFDLQRTRFNPNEDILTSTNVSGLVPDWTFTSGGFVDSSPTVANGMVYVGSEDGKLYAFNASTGKPLWTASTGGIIYYSSPAVSDGVVYVGSKDHQLYAFNASTGKLLWKASTGNSIFSSPAIANGIVYVGSSDGKLYAFKISSCSISCSPFWTAATRAAITYSSPAVANGMVYIGSDDHNLYAFNATGCGQASCPPVWMASAGDVVRSSPTVANGVVYVGSDDGKLYALNAAGCGNTSCAPLWMASTGGHIFSSPTLDNGEVYVGSQDSKLYTFHLNGATP